MMKRFGLILKYQQQEKLIENNKIWKGGQK